MQWFVLSFGKIKTPGLRDTADHYLKLLRAAAPHTGVQEIELKAAVIRGKSGAERLETQSREARATLEWITKNAGSRPWIVLLSEEGRALRSQDWARSLSDWEQKGFTSVVWIVGGALGLGEELRAAIAKKIPGTLLSLGPQTLSHELARVVVFEQLYRAAAIRSGHPYHHEGV